MAHSVWVKPYEHTPSDANITMLGTAAGVLGASAILVLTARQPQLPPGWNSHVRYYVAIHAGSGQGSAVSAGCLHATEADVHYLMRTVPLGTSVQILR